MEKNTGSELETRVYDTIASLLEKGELGLLKDSCRVYRGKGYYSRDRESDIFTDVSVEVYPKGSDMPAIVWIWECKDYRVAVSVDELEEFHAKLSQIGGDNTKGTVITSKGAFQTGAVRYARSKGIGLARLLPGEQVHWILYDALPHVVNAMELRQIGDTRKALTVMDYVSNRREFFALRDGGGIVEDEFGGFVRAELLRMVEKYYEKSKNNSAEDNVG